MFIPVQMPGHRPLGRSLVSSDVWLLNASPAPGKTFNVFIALFGKVSDEYIWYLPEENSSLKLHCGSANTPAT